VELLQRREPGRGHRALERRARHRDLVAGRCDAAPVPEGALADRAHQHLEPALRDRLRRQRPSASGAGPDRRAPLRRGLPGPHAADGAAPARTQPPGVPDHEPGRAAGPPGPPTPCPGPAASRERSDGDPAGAGAEHVGTDAGPQGRRRDRVAGGRLCAPHQAAPGERAPDPHLGAGEHDQRGSRLQQRCRDAADVQGTDGDDAGAIPGRVLAGTGAAGLRAAAGCAARAAGAPWPRRAPRARRGASRPAPVRGVRPGTAAAARA